MISQPTLILLKTVLEKQLYEQRALADQNAPLYQAYIEIKKHIEVKQQKEKAKAAIPFVLRKDRLKQESKI